MARTSRKNHVPDQIIPEISDTEIFRTAIYLRLSLEDNGKKDGDSMENQQKMLRTMSFPDRISCWWIPIWIMVTQELTFLGQNFPE